MNYLIGSTSSGLVRIGSQEFDGGPSLLSNPKFVDKRRASMAGVGR